MSHRAHLSYWEPQLSPGDCIPSEQCLLCAHAGVWDGSPPGGMQPGVTARHWRGGAGYLYQAVTAPAVMLEMRQLLAARIS